MEKRLRKTFITLLIGALCIPVPTGNGAIVFAGYPIIASLFGAFLYISAALSLPNMYSFTIENAGRILTTAQKAGHLWFFILQAVNYLLNFWWSYIYAILIVWNFNLMKQPSQTSKNFYRIYLLISIPVLIYINVDGSRFPDDEPWSWPLLVYWCMLNMLWFAVVIEAWLWRNEILKNNTTDIKSASA